MIRYVKGAAPGRLTALTTTPAMTWDGMGAQDRDPIREALLRDQGALCAYCQRRIHLELDPATGLSRMKIEHWLARANHPSHHFTWTNLLGVCPGWSVGEQHCDESRGNRALFLHPVDGLGPDPRHHLRYTKDGKVEAVGGNHRVTDDIDALNLAAGPLARGRAAVYDALVRRLERTNFSVPELRKVAREHRIVPGTRTPEHAEFVRYHVLRWLRQRGETE